MRTMAKAPAFQFYPRDWLSDTELQQASPSSRGIWINLLSHMWFSQTRGEVSGPIEELRRLAGCTESEWLIFYEQNCRLKFADVTFSDGNVTVKNRRMIREERERNLATCRKSRQRERERHAEITPPSASASPSPTTKKKKEDSSSDQAALPLIAPPLPPPLLKILLECRNLALVSNGDSAPFWERVLGSCHPYGVDTDQWLGVKLRSWDQWFDSNPSRKSTSRKRLESRLMGWLSKDLERLARTGKVPEEPIKRGSIYPDL